MSTGPVYEVTHGQLFKYALISENEVKRELSKASYDLATIKDSESSTGGLAWRSCMLLRGTRCCNAVIPASHGLRCEW